MIFDRFLSPTPERIRKWRSQGSVGPILKALEHKDSEIQYQVAEALGFIMRQGTVPEKLINEAAPAVLKLARRRSSMGVYSSDERLFDYLYILCKCKSREVGDYFHELLKKERDALLLRQIIPALCYRSGDGETCRIVLELIKNKELAYTFEEDFVQCEGARLLDKKLDDEGVDSDLLQLYCDAASKKGPAQNFASRILRQVLGHETDSQARQKARAWLKSKHTSVNDYARKFLGPDEELPSDERELTITLKAVADGKEHSPTLQDLVEQTGEASVPVLERFLKEDLNGRYGRAAVMGLRKLPPKLAMPLIEEAVKSTYAAVRYYAAEYLLANPSDRAKELARKRLQSESDEDVKRIWGFIVEG